MNRIIKYILYFGFVAMLLIPSFFLIFKTKLFSYELRGDIQLVEKPELSKETWLNSEFQTQYANYINDSVLYYTTIVRIYNQLQFSLYGQTTAKDVIIGKNNILYELNYIKSYNGTNYRKSDTILSVVKDLKLTQDYLESKGKTFFLVISPGKGYFYPENFPKEYKATPTDSTNYYRYIHYLDEYGINYIDVNKWFLSIKDTCDCNLYPKNGIHWSIYGMLNAADSIIRYVEQQRDINLANIIFDDIKKTKVPEFTDSDIADGMNLMFQLKEENLCYPQYHWEEVDTSNRPNTIVISDSFYWSMYNMGMHNNAFKLGAFWYYYWMTYPQPNDTTIYVGQLDFDKYITESEVVIMMTSETNLYTFSWGFLEKIIGFYGLKTTNVK